MLTFLALALLQSAPAPAAPPQWAYKENKDAAGVLHSASAMIRSEDGLARLVVKCDIVDEPVVTVQFLPKPALQAGAPRNVTLTLDEAYAETSPWQRPGGGAFTGEPAETFRIVGQIAAAKRIDVVLVNDSGTTIGATFDGPGGDAMFKQVYTACNVPYAPLEYGKKKK
jgi:hypothetical protein